jgi:aspartate/methionine/tyrosine aminotransferase
MAGATYKPVPLELVDGNWTFNPAKFKEALNSKTKILILNNAHNPTGKIFSREELELITNILAAYPNVIVISDDVYEYLTFDGKQSTLFASLGSNFDRTVSVFSGGKLFSATGWKVGWAIGPSDIINAASVVSATTIYCVNAPA